jgi:hypothetical protein
MANEIYAELAALKDWLGNSDDNRDDYALSTALVAASRAIDNWTHRRFSIDDTASDFYTQPLGQTIFTPDMADISDLAIAVDRDGSKTFAIDVDATDDVFLVKPSTAPYRSIVVQNVTLYPSDLVRVTALFGFPSVPVEIEQATLILAARYYKRAQSPEGVAGFGDFGVVRVSRTDADVEALIGPYRIHAWA